MNETQGNGDAPRGSGVMREALRAIRAAVRARALEAKRRGGDAYEDAEIAEEQAAVAAQRFGEGPRQLEEASLRRLYATVWEDDELEDLLVGLVAAETLSTAAVPSPPADLAGRMVATMRRTSTTATSPWRVTGQAILEGLTAAARQLLGLRPVGTAVPEVGRTGSLDVGDLAGAGARAVEARGQDAVAVAYVPRADGDDRLCVTLDQPAEERWRVNVELLAGKGQDVVGEGWQLAATLDGRAIGGAFRRQGLWAFDERLSLEEVGRLALELDPTQTHGGG